MRECPQMLSSSTTFQRKRGTAQPQTQEGAPSRKTIMASGAGLLGNQDLSLTGGGAGVASEEAATVAPSQAAPPIDVSPISSAAGAHPAAGVREQDRFMPIANVIRIMRRVLPAHAKIADDAKEMIQECVSEYISFITSEANERCQREQRKTVTAEDVLWAMNKLGFDDYIEPLTLFLHRYREIEGDHRGSLRADAIHIIKHRNSGASNSSGNAPPPSAGAEQFFGTAPLPPPSFVMPPPAPQQQPPQHLNLLSENMVSYFLNMYGSGEGPSGSGGGYGSQVPGMPNFDHPFPPPPPPPPSYK